MDQSLPNPIPRSVVWLGYGGLLPFLVLAPASLFDPHHATIWSDALFAYGALILTFVGALHWGFAMTLTDLSASQRTWCFVWSVVPTLIAWSALLFSPMPASVLLVTGFLAHYWQDRFLIAASHLPAWYLPLRFRLTSVACLCLTAGAFAESW
ncbi:MAG: DUF3429 domain-containing protein [Candidatus Accumulibacter sp.]|uniref:DUF3429 domain-containing protein n=1 Tax=Accumulibacter sp. TaxID=2053492 RepID=UPI001D760355|nr:DUF3429 domain-containing protein [Accumulibacter sp.]MCB1942722.1 DUF3429 domain-containing protein [Accumulibacter sp.]MCP5249084.1 DUF3429 domain-containing protein [Accumulibacter sp.]